MPTFWKAMLDVQTVQPNSNWPSPVTTSAAVIEWEENNSENTILRYLLEALDQKDSSSQGQIKVGQQLSQLQRSELGTITDQYQNMFYRLPGMTDLITHHIRTSDEISVQAKPYSVPYKHREALQVKVQEMLNMGIIRKSH